MNLKNLVFEMPWLLPDEKSLSERFQRDMFTLFRRHGVEATPILLLRVDDVLHSYLMVRRLETTFLTLTSSEASPPVACAQEASDIEAQKKEPNEKPKKKETKEPNVKKDGENVQLEVLGKARDRLRKAMKELEEGCAKAFKPLNQGVADRMKPVLKKAEGILEESLSADAAEDISD